LRVEESVTSIDHEEAKEWFENLLAARRLIQNVNDLPANVREELRAVLKSEEEVAPNKIVTLGSAPPASVNEESAARIKRFP
jgi:DNA-directed RNA polymerase subunit F